MSILSDELKALITFMAKSCQPPPLRGMRIVEVGSHNETDVCGRLRVRQDQFCAPEHYESRFKELIEQGLPWLNLSCFGIHNGFLIVGVETPNQCSRPSRRTSVNYSGPPVSVLDRGWDAYQILAIE